MLELINLKKEYIVNKKNGIRIQALDGITIRFPDNGLVAVVGKSGCGKTTLLNMIAGVDIPTLGNVVINGEDLNTFKESDFDFYRNFYVGLIFQEYNLLNDYSVIENIRLACRLQGKDKGNTHNRALEALRLVGMEELAQRKINSLSGGQQQRVAIARAIAKDSKIILCDEPTGNLDSKTSQEIYELLGEVAKDRLVIVVSHDREFADSFADRVIVISDGKVVDDRITNISSDIREIKRNVPIKGLKKKKNGIPVKDIFLMIKDNFVKSLISNIVVIILLTATIALSTVFLSLSQYSQEDAFINTLKANDYYVLQLSKFIDYPREEIDPYTNEKYIQHGPVVFYEKADISDIENLKDITGSKATYYPSYFFEKNLQDFTTQSIYTDQTAFQFHARSFREMIAVEDFSTYNLQLLYGQKPQDINDILIYDYMASSLLHYEIFQGEMADIIDKVLVDQDTGLSMRIRGIIKSDYERYSYIDKDRNTYEFEETYLTSLQVVFCQPEFVELVASENRYDSLFKCYFVDDENQAFINTNIKKSKFINFDNITFLTTIDNYTQERGVVVNRATVAYLMSVDIGDVNESIAEEFMQRYSVSGIDTFYDTSIERSYLIGFSQMILGVADEGLTESVLYCYTPNEEDFYMNNGEFRQIYLSLGTDWKANKEILRNFAFTIYSDEFYTNNPTYYYEGYTDYTPYGLLIRDADSYLNDVKDFSQTIVIILICVSVLGMFFFAVLTIKKYSYKIGVLKAMGAGNGNITLLFGLQIVLVAVLAFILSIPFGFIVMNGINATFVNRINSDLVFFAIKPAAQGIMLGISLLSVIVSAAIPLVNLYFSTPIKIIKNNNRK
jgi:ABC-type lipoprotein export system ATPase subunit/ABC-type antimicrobial peptide transport system permease subunit